MSRVNFNRHVFALYSGSGERSIHKIATTGTSIYIEKTGIEFDKFGNPLILMSVDNEEPIPVFAGMNINYPQGFKRVEFTTSSISGYATEVVISFTPVGSISRPQMRDMGYHRSFPNISGSNYGTFTGMVHTHQGMVTTNIISLSWAAGDYAAQLEGEILSDNIGRIAGVTISSHPQSPTDFWVSSVPWGVERGYRIPVGGTVFIPYVHPLYIATTSTLPDAYFTYEYIGD